MKIGLVNCQWVDSHGAVWVAYSLQETVKKISGCDDVEVIDYAESSRKQIKLGFGIFLKIAKKIKKIIFTHTEDRKIIEQIKKRHKLYEQFRKNYLNRTDRFTKLDSDILKNKYSHYITGSDVVWKPERAMSSQSYVYFLRFAQRNSKKISYAASIGTDDDNVLMKLKDKYKSLISDFDYISVREKSAAEFLGELVKQPVEVVIDPVFLLDKSDYEKIINQKERVCANKYIYIYLLSVNKKAIDFAIEIAKKNNWKIIYYMLSKECKIFRKWLKEYDSMELIQTGPLEFVNLIRNAELIISNSFHATVFSLIFHKEFFAFGRINAGIDISARIKDLLCLLNIGGRYIKNDYIQVDKQPIDYDSVDEKINILREKSLKYLSKVLQ